MQLTRSLWALPALLLLLLASCRREESLEMGITSRYDFQDIFGSCLGDSVVGNYVAGTALNGDSSYVLVKVNVRVPGNYSINSDIQNGFSFSGSGAFPDTGLVTLRIPARGTPQTVQPTTLRFTHDSVYCEVLVNVTATAQGGGTCNAQVAGNYYKDTALRGTNLVTISHNYTAAGTYTVGTDTINGYHFEKSVTVSAPGATTIVLNGVGTPAATGTNSFTVRFGDGGTCGFPVTVSAVTPPAGGCTGSFTGTYTAGTALAAGAGLQVSNHTYATAGSYTISAATVNGVSFTTATVNATAGTPAGATLAATGTPTAAGTFPVVVSYGDGSNCTFNLTVVTGGTTPSGDYFPLTDNSWWSYNKPGTASDTLTRRVMWNTSLSGQIYRAFYNYNNINNPTDSFFYRKDGAGVTYESWDLNDEIGFGLNVTFPVGSRADLPIVKDALTAGATWLSGAYTGTSSSVSSQYRLSFTCTNVLPTLTVNSRTFSNVYEVKTVLQYNMGFGWVDYPFGSDIRTQWFAPGVGLVKEKQPIFSAAMELRNYVVY